MADIDVFKEYINKYGKEIDAQITVGEYTFKGDEIINLTYSYEGKLFSSVMKRLDFEVQGEWAFIKGVTARDVKVGVKAGDSYVYVNKGEFIITEAEYDVATNSTKCECYDGIINSMVYYDLSLDADSFPMTMGDYFALIGNRLGLSCAIGGFTNSSVEITEEKFTDEYTYRDILDQIAQVAGGTVAMKNGFLSVLYPNATGVIIDESNLKTLTIGEKYGRLNSLVLARSPQEDNIVVQDEADIEANGMKEVRFENNLLMDDDRDAFKDSLLTRLKDVECQVYELDSFGIVYLDICDQFTIQKINGTTYTAILVNDTIEVAQGISEQAKFEIPEETTTDYEIADTTDRRINQTYLKVDKIEQNINAVVSRTEKLEGDAESAKKSLGEITKSVNATMTAEDIQLLVSRSVSGVNSVTTSTGFTFNKDGLKIEKSGKDIYTLIDEDGMDISNGTENLLTVNSQGVNAINLKSSQFLIVGQHSRFQDFDNGVDSYRTGCFWLKGS